MKNGSGICVYITEICKNTQISELFSEERNAEIQSTKNERIRLEKYSAFKLLERAVFEELAIDAREAGIYKNENGRWTGRDFDFSISHTDGAVAVVVSKESVGIDIERVSYKRHASLAKKYLNQAEFDEYSALCDEEQEVYFLKKWTAKEAFFKAKNEPQFVPSKVNPTDADASVMTADFFGGKYVLALSPKNEKITVKTV